ncbi:MAG: hypothetical protein H7240_11300 [Glaciimonas sp.]|nr:hypothetical protein [Glaciimonas sp.]
MMTDGYWNEGEVNNLPLPLSVDNQDRRIPFLPAAVNLDPVSGTPLFQGLYFPPPFSEGPIATANTLPDVAMKYWSMDIRFRTSNGGAAGDITPTATDPASWQNMVIHSIGINGNGKLRSQSDYKMATSGDYADIKNGKKLANSCNEYRHHRR